MAAQRFQEGALEQPKGLGLLQGVSMAPLLFLLPLALQPGDGLRKVDSCHTAANTAKRTLLLLIMKAFGGREVSGSSYLVLCFGARDGRYVG